MIVDAGAIVAGRLDRQGIDNDNNLKPTITCAAQLQTDHPFSGGGNDGERNIIRASMVLVLEYC